MGGHGSTASALPTGMRVVSEPLFAGRPGLPGSPPMKWRRQSARFRWKQVAPARTSPAKPAGMNCRRTLSPGDSQRGLPHGGALRRASPVASSIEKAEAGFAVHGLRL